MVAYSRTKVCLWSTYDFCGTVLWPAYEFHGTMELYGLLTIFVSLYIDQFMDFVFLKKFS